MRENPSSGFANKKCADQPANPFTLISAFVIHFLESIILANFHFFYKLVSVAEGAALSPILSENQKTGFLATMSILHCHG